ncbi:unnamed protein product [Calicophoron daubneyi]|uniref:Uncharacterized protein n=1 Tax=Calicophoron daubneyi TaxID=300641 RepID=A0AAV2U139_CALDB
MDWETADVYIHKLICGTDPFSTVVDKVSDALRQFILVEGSSPIQEQFSRRLVTFFELDPDDQYLLLEIVSVLGLDRVMESLSELLLSREGNSWSQVNWRRLLALVGAMITAVRGSVSSIRGLIRRVLDEVFCPSNNRSDDLTEAKFLDANAESSQGIKNTSPTNMELFMLALLLARQLCTEDTRLTGITYSQWWSETFTSNSSASISSPQLTGFTFSHSDFILFTNLLVELLQWEHDPRLLQIQLTSKPSCLASWSRSSKTKSNLNPGSNEAEGKPDDLTGDFIGNAAAELETLDASLMNSCVQQWNDYVEIGRGRLAELRETPSDHPMTDPTHAGITENPFPTPGWEDVLAWIRDVANQLSSAADNGDRPQNCRLPHSLSEAVLFQPLHLRSVLIPALLNAPELGTLSSELKVAHAKLLLIMKQSGLAGWLESNAKGTGSTRTQGKTGVIAVGRKPRAQTGRGSRGGQFNKRPGSANSSDGMTSKLQRSDSTSVFKNSSTTAMVCSDLSTEI